MILTRNELRKLLHYNPRTGIFTRRKAVGSTKVGDTIGCIHASGYLVCRINQKTYLMHRLAFLYMRGRFPAGDVDHINGNRADNRFANLREATRSENNQNIRRAQLGSKSGLLGAQWNVRKQKWYAQIRVNNKKHFLGYFDTKEEAHQAYMNAKRIHHPEFGEIAK